MAGLTINSIVCMDALEFLKGLPAHCADMVLADMPYGITACKWDSVIPLEPMWRHLKRVVKPNAAIVMTASQPFASALVMSNPAWFRHEWIWLKNRGSNFANTVREPMKEHESVLVFSAGDWTYNKQMQPRTGGGSERAKYKCDFITCSDNYSRFNDKRNNILTEMRVPSSWQKFNTPTGREKTKHPTQKPLALMEYMVKTYSNEGDTVLDFAMGSGTTAIACIRTGRQYLCCDLSPEYCEMARKRIREETELPLFQGT